MSKGRLVEVEDEAKSTGGRVSISIRIKIKKFRLKMGNGFHLQVEWELASSRSVVCNGLECCIPKCLAISYDFCFVVTLQVCSPSPFQENLVREREQEGLNFLWAIMSAQRDPVDLNKQ